MKRQLTLFCILLVFCFGLAEIAKGNDFLQLDMDVHFNELDAVDSLE